jgi:hypothetical protein
MRFGFSILIVVFSLFALTSCGEDLGGGPEIVSMTISPDTLSVTETGMTDQFFTVTLEVAGFTDEIDLEETRVFIQGTDEVDAVFQTSAQVGNTITLGMIATGWFQTQVPGVYDIGASVQTIAGDTGQPTEQVTQLNLATVTITE